MTDAFDELYKTIISEVLVGSKKRNKRLEENNTPDVNHITPTPRIINKHPAHIRPVGQSIGNETGVHSKDPNAKPVYAKGGLRRMKNASQRSRSLRNSPYSSNHDKFGTRRTLATRREKLLKSVYESMENTPEYGTYRLYFITNGRQDVLKTGTPLTMKRQEAMAKADNLTRKNKKYYSVVRIIIYHDKETPLLAKGKSDTSFYYSGTNNMEGTVEWTTDVDKYHFW